ncbi:MAG: siderophore-interacting protein [Jatrophihabitans sp.]
MTSGTPRKRLALAFQVQRTETLTPHLRRAVLGGPAFDAFVERSNEHTDKYVKLQFLHPDAQYPEPLDLETVRATLPAEHWPVVRTYTVRWVDPDARELAVDFVIHGDEGIAGPWAMNAQPGDTLHLLGPGGAYHPSADADWYLLAGDESALPAISAAIEAMPDGAAVRAFVEVDGPQGEVPLATAADLHVTWLHRGDAAPGTTTLIADAVRSWEWPAGQVQVFVHGESGLLKALRSYFLTERGLSRDRVSLSGYWRVGASEEGFRRWKSEQGTTG